MKIVEKYLWRSVVLPTVFIIAALFALWLMFDIFDQIGRMIVLNPPASLLIKFFLVQLPSLAQSILPVSILFSTLYVMAYFSKHRETVAFVASGMSPILLARPFLITSLLLSAVLYLFSYSLSPTSQASRRQTTREIRKLPTEVAVYRQVVYRSPKLTNTRTSSLWYAGEIDLRTKTASFLEVLVRKEPEGKDWRKIFSNRAKYTDGQWHFLDARVAEYSDDRTSGTLGPCLEDLVLPELTDPPENLVAKLLPPDELPWPMVSRLAQDRARLSSRLRAPYATEFWLRVAYPLSCPMLCLFGIALGMNDGRRNVAATVFGSVFVLFGFLVCTRIFVALGQGNRISSFLAGTGTLVLFGSWGIYLFAEKVGWLWELQGWSRHHLLTQPWLRRVGLVSR